MKRAGLLFISVLIPVLLYSQTPEAGFDFKQAEQAIESVMSLEIDDPETQEQACVIASMVGVYQFSDHRYEAAIRSLEYAISHSKSTNTVIQIQNHVFLIHALCLQLLSGCLGKAAGRRYDSQCMVIEATRSVQPDDVRVCRADAICRKHSMWAAHSLPCCPHRMPS